MSRSEEPDVSIRPYRIDDAAALLAAALESVVEVHPFLPWCHPDLKAKSDGTMMEGHHRIYVLRERGVDVDALPREYLKGENAG